MILDETERAALIKATHNHPHDILGMHPCHPPGASAGVVVRAFLRGATACEVVDCGGGPERRYGMAMVDPAGLFEGFIEGRESVFPYRLRAEQTNGEIRQFHDPYRFLPSLSEDDLYRFNEGTEHRVHEKLGGHPREIDGVPGVGFAVWAPSAARVSVVGDFNCWDGRYHPMRQLGSSGVWELFIPGRVTGETYKYEVLGPDGFLRLKTDPYALYYESPPHNASIVRGTPSFPWGDADWMERRAKTDWRREPISIYEVHLGSWKRVPEDGDRPLNYREAGAELAAHVKDLGFTHVEFLPLAEHPFDGSWGYQVTGFFAPTHRYGEPEDFQCLVDTLHREGIGVILDWVPAHFPRDAFALAEFDGTCLYEHADPRQGHHQDWGTLIFNYGRHEVRGFLAGSALSWLDRFHLDGLRVDAVASMLYLDYSRDEGEWIPNVHGGRENLEAIAFLRETNRLVHEYWPGVLMIAEESTAFPGVTRRPEEGGLGFDFKWNMGWMHDTLNYFSKDPVHRRWHHSDLTFGMVYQNSEAFVQTFSHDEVVHGKGSLLQKMAAGTIAEKAQQLRALYALTWAWPGKKCLFMGSEFGQSAEWAYDRSLDWHLLRYTDHAGVQAVVRDLNHLYREEPALHRLDHAPEGFSWSGFEDAESSVISFLRHGERPGETCLAVGHFTPVARRGYRVGVPAPGFWREIFNSDAAVYGGGGGGNAGGCEAEAVPWDGLPFSLQLTLPPQSTLILKCD